MRAGAIEPGNRDYSSNETPRETLPRVPPMQRDNQLPFCDRRMLETIAGRFVNGSRYWGVPCRPATVRYTTCSPRLKCSFCMHPLSGLHSRYGTFLSLFSLGPGAYLHLIYSEDPLRAAVKLDTKVSSLCIALRFLDIRPSQLS